jgi:hypothetical protein
MTCPEESTAGQEEIEADVITFKESSYKMEVTDVKGYPGSSGGHSETAGTP